MGRRILVDSEEKIEGILEDLGKIEGFQGIPEENTEKVDDLEQETSIVNEPVHRPPTPINSSSKKTPLTITQGCFRGYLKRSRLSKRASAAIIIQKHVRRHQCRAIYLEIREAVIFIQSVYRGHLVRKSLKSSKAAN